MTMERVVSQLSGTSGQKDQSANIELAEKVCQTEDHSTIGLLVDILRTGSSAHKKDAIKVLYEVGARQPELIMPYTAVFFDGIESRDNRIVWGSLKALAKICSVSPERVADRLDLILGAADNGSVIAKDQAIEILLSVKTLPDHGKAASSALFERLQTAAVNQLPKYAELLAANLLPEEKETFLSILDMRLRDQISEAKRRRLRKAREVASTTPT